MPHHSPEPGDPRLAARLDRELRGEVRFDALHRGLYSTDASIYQIEPIGVVVPRDADDVARTVEIAGEVGVPLLPRGAGTSQGGQVVGRALVMDLSKYLTGIVRVDEEAGRVTVEPGVVLDRLNAVLRPTGLFFPVDVATSSRATLGGMAGNNSAGARSIKYGVTADHVLAIDAVLADGSRARFGPPPATTGNGGERKGTLPTVGRAREGRAAELAGRVRSIRDGVASELAARVPRVPRHVAGYNLHRVSGPRPNLAELLVGSEGTLAVFTALELALAPLPSHRVLGVCHFPSLGAALDAVQHIVTLDPSAVELVDGTVIALARGMPGLRSRVERFVRGEPRALLLVEFSGSEADGVARSLHWLEELMGELGHPGAVVRASDVRVQAEVWAVRKTGLNIVMSMKGPRKPVSFIEDCAIPLPRLAEWGERIDALFRRHGTEPTWYAHASVGCLHVRPSLDLRDPADVGRLRAIAEETHEIVRQLGGSHSGEHGDGIVRSEFIEPMLGAPIARAFEEVKAAFDPHGLLNPGKIVHPPRMDDRTLFRLHPGYAPADGETVLDWTSWGGLAGAVEMCNNNGACRKSDPGVMCPSWRVTRDEMHGTRGRANALRLAISGQLGPERLDAASMYETMSLCVGCKGCRRECPMGVDVARMKIEFLAAWRRTHGLGLRERLVAYLPRYAPWASRAHGLVNLRNRSRVLAWFGERAAGLSARRPLPEWKPDRLGTPHGPALRPGGGGGSDGEGRVILFVDTFSRYFESENVRAATSVLEAAGRPVRLAAPSGGRRPLCCGRTFLNVGLVEEAKVEARRTLAALLPEVERGTPVVGIEPSCLLTFRDEYAALLPGEGAEKLAGAAVLVEELLARDRATGRPGPALAPLANPRIRIHGHCHQKALDAMDAVPEVLSWIPGADVSLLESGCCGMAGSFGYEAEHHDVSMAMAELELLPAVRETPEGDWLVADGTSCRRQIHDGAGREAFHAVRVLEAALASPPVR